MRGAKVLLGTLTALGLAAQPMRLAGPLSGFVFDSGAAGIRPILGLPGAAYAGEVIASGLQWASVAPGGAAALAYREGALYGLSGLERLEPVWSPVESALGKPDRAAWSADGSLAVIYSAAAGLAQLVRNPGARAAAGEPLPVGGGVTALAVDSQGRIVAGLPDGVYLFDPQAPASLLAPVQGAVAIALAGDRLWAAGAGGEIVEVEDYAGRPKAVLLASVPDPVGLAVSPDGKSLFVAGRADRAVEIYDLASRTTAGRLPLEVEPTTLEALSADALWLLRASAAGSDPLWVLKARPEPGLWFVPVGRGE
jgi:hypothetical protein